MRTGVCIGPTGLEHMKCVTLLCKFRINKTAYCPKNIELLNVCFMLNLVFDGNRFSQRNEPIIGFAQVVD